MHEAGLRLESLGKLFEKCGFEECPKLKKLL
jgi:hypothetical protein